MDWDLSAAEDAAVSELEALMRLGTFFVVGSFEEWKNDREGLLNRMFVQLSCDSV